MVYRKYHNKRVQFGGRKFDSKLEMTRYIYLMEAQRCGVISDLKCQVRFELFPQWKIGKRVYKRATTYTADFTYRKGGSLIVEDTKGMETPVFKLKEIAMHFILHIDIRKVRKATEDV